MARNSLVVAFRARRNRARTLPIPSVALLPLVMNSDLGRVRLMRLLIAIGFGIMVALIARSVMTRSDVPPGLQKAMDEARNQAAEDFEGEPGRKAREICSRKLGITKPVKTGSDVLRYYDLEKAKAYIDCVVDNM